MDCAEAKGENTHNQALVKIWMKIEPYKVLIDHEKIGKFDPGKTKLRPVLWSLSGMIFNAVFVIKQKLKRKVISISENLTKLSFIKLKEVKDQQTSGNVWSHGLKRMYKDDDDELFLW